MSRSYRDAAIAICSDYVRIESPALCRSGHPEKWHFGLFWPETLETEEPLSRQRHP
jgi:hypothetical protein